MVQTRNQKKMATKPSDFHRVQVRIPRRRQTPLIPTHSMEACDSEVPNAPLAPTFKREVVDEEPSTPLIQGQPTPAQAVEAINAIFWSGLTLMVRLYSPAESCLEINRVLHYALVQHVNGEDVAFTPAADWTKRDVAWVLRNVAESARNIGRYTTPVGEQYKFADWAQWAADMVEGRAEVGVRGVFPEAFFAFLGRALGRWNSGIFKVWGFEISERNERLEEGIELKGNWVVHGVEEEDRDVKMDVDSPLRQGEVKDEDMGTEDSEIKYEENEEVKMEVGMKEMETRRESAVSTADVQWD